MTGSAQAVVDALADVATPRRALIDHMAQLKQPAHEVGRPAPP